MNRAQWSHPIHRRVREEREERGWSMQELARPAGVQTASSENAENGWSVPRPETIAKLAHALDVPPEALTHTDMRPLHLRDKPWRNAVLDIMVLEAENRAIRDAERAARRAARQPQRHTP